MRINYPSPNQIIIDFNDQQGQIRTNAVGLESIISTLSEKRRHIQPEVPRSLSGVSLSNETDPMWSVTSNPESQSLNFRHPGYGWLSFSLSNQQARLLGRMLLDDPEAP